MNAQHRSDFGTFGRYTELPLDKMTPDQKRPMNLQSKSAEKCLDLIRSGCKIPS
jgi:hypothetical protein